MRHLLFRRFFPKFSLVIIGLTMAANLTPASAYGQVPPAATANASACLLDISRISEADLDPADLRLAVRDAMRTILANMSPRINDADPNSDRYLGEILASGSSPAGSSQVSYTEFVWLRDAGITAQALVTALLDDDMLREDIFNNPNQTIEDRRKLLLQQLMYHLGYVKTIQGLDSTQLGTSGIQAQKDANGNIIGLLVHPAYGLAKRARDNSEPQWMNPQIDGAGYSSAGSFELVNFLIDKWDQYFGPSGGVQTNLTRDDLMAAVDQTVSSNVSRRKTHEKLNIPAVNGSILYKFFNYIKANWKVSTYEMWEEEKSSAGKDGPTFDQQGGHFATLTALQNVMMFDAPSYAARFGAPGDSASFQQVAIAINNKLAQFWDGQNNIIVPTLGQLEDSRPTTNGAPKFVDSDTRVFNGVKASAHIDSQVLIGLCHSKSPTFSVTSDMAMSYVYNLRQIFKGFYPINQGKNFTLLGRYINDIYSGITQDGSIVRKSQPWTFTTEYDAEFSYRWAEDQSGYAQLHRLLDNAGGSDIQLDGKLAQLLFNLSFLDNANSSFNIFNQYPPDWAYKGFTLKASAPMYGYFKKIVSQQSLKVSTLNVNYLNGVLSRAGYSDTVSVGQVIGFSDVTLSKLITAHVLVGDLTVRGILSYADAQGGLSEQIDPASDGQTGVAKQRSAPKLTWSSGVIVRLVKARKLAIARARP